MGNIKLRVQNEKMKLPPDVLQAAGNDELVARILVNRGVDTPEKITRFLNPGIYTPVKPGDFPGMDSAIEIIDDAIRSKQKIAVYGDYDADGITSTVALTRCLRSIGGNTVYYIPNRFREGYGMNKDAIITLLHDDVRLIITCDCGISNTSEIKLAKESGIRVIVTDHHSIPDNLPPADVILNPKLLFPEHPAYNLSGCGMAYFLCRGLLEHYGKSELHTEYFDLVALSIIADAVPLTDENRYLLSSCLPYLLNTNRIGLKALYGKIGSGAPKSREDIAFQVAPRINAAGRLDSARTAIELLLCEDLSKAEELASKLDSLNLMRKDIQERILEEAVRITELEKAHKSIIIIYNSAWHHGILGIAAGKLAEKYKKPVILLSLKEDEGVITGSARSVSGLDIHDLLKTCGRYLEKFGGHPMAAGLSIKPENLEDFIAEAENMADRILPVGRRIEFLADARLPLCDINRKLYNRIEILEPYGEGFKPPSFISLDVTVLSDRISDKGHHFLVLTGGDGARLNAVKWHGDRSSLEGKTFDILYGITAYNDKDTGDINLKLNIEHMLERESMGRALSERFRGSIIDERNTNIDTVLSRYPGAVIFFEGLKSRASGYDTESRATLKESSALLFWSIPASIDIFKEAVHIAKPGKIILNFTNNAAFDFKSYILDILGVVKHIISTHNGITTLEYLSSILCVEENILKTSFTYLRNYGKIEFEFDLLGDRVVFQKGTGKLKKGDFFAQTENNLKKALLDKQSYQQYMMNLSIDKFYEILS